MPHVVLDLDYKGIGEEEIRRALKLKPAALEVNPCNERLVRSYAGVIPVYARGGVGSWEIRVWSKDEVSVLQRMLQATSDGPVLEPTEVVESETPSAVVRVPKGDGKLHKHDGIGYWHPVNRTHEKS